MQRVERVLAPSKLAARLISGRRAAPLIATATIDTPTATGSALTGEDTCAPEPVSSEPPSATPAPTGVIHALEFARRAAPLASIAAAPMDTDETDPRVPATPAVDGEENSDDTLMRDRAVVGTLIGGRYKLLERLAIGGMGEVYRAEHLELGRPFALKLMRKELSDDPNFVGRFRREAVTASRLGHPNIVDIIDSGRSETGQFYFVMELLDGPTLGELLRRAGTLTLPLALELCTQVARGLSVAHRAGIVHRDLKPENIIVLERPGQGPHVKLVDFGIAKQVEPSPDIKQTTHGIIVGTPQYMAPEQAAGLPLDARADLYALGLILYELLVGTPPFTAPTAVLLMSKHISDAPPQLPSSFPAPLRRLVASLLSKAPSERPASMDAVVETLSALAATLRAQAGEGDAPRRSGRPAWVVPLLALAAACAVVVGWGLWLKPSPPAPMVVEPRVVPAILPAVPPAAPTLAPVAVISPPPVAPAALLDAGVDAGLVTPRPAPPRLQVPRPPAGPLKSFPTDEP